jgi:hypothetical protein
MSSSSFVKRVSPGANRKALHPTPDALHPISSLYCVQPLAHNLLPIACLIFIHSNLFIAASAAFIPSRAELMIPPA